MLTKLAIKKTYPGGPSGKALVQPETLPPVHGDKVTKPLMSQLVLDDLGNTLLGSGTAGLLVKQQVDNTISNKTPVLHSALGKVGNSNLVHLGEGELDAKDLFVELEGSNSKVEGEAAVLNVLARRSVDTDGNAEGGGLDVVELTNDEGYEIGGHERGGVEVDSLLGGATNGGLDLGLVGNVHVTQASQVLVGNEGDGELGLESRFVKARESSAAVGSLHLSGSEDTFGAVVALECRSVETSHLVIQLTGELDLKLGLGALGEGSIEVELADLGFLIKGNLGGGADKVSNKS